MSEHPEGTVLIEIRGIYDGWSVAKLPNGDLVNRWMPGDRRYAPTRQWIELFQQEKGSNSEDGMS